MTALLFFAGAAIGSGGILAALVAHEMPRILTTLALVLTLAALGAALIH
ncbi:hypothetical protein [Streptomyces sp. NPDC060184]